MDLGLIDEPYLTLGWMHIDVDLTRIDLEKDRIGRMTAFGQTALVGIINGMRHGRVFNRPPVDEDGLEPTCRSDGRRLGYSRGHPNPLSSGLKR